MCFDATWDGDCLCLKTVKTAQKELFDAWFRTSGCSILPWKYDVVTCMEWHARSSLTTRVLSTFSLRKSWTWDSKDGLSWLKIMTFSFSIIREKPTLKPTPWAKNQPSIYVATTFIYGTRESRNWTCGTRHQHDACYHDRPTCIDRSCKIEATRRSVLMEDLRKDADQAEAWLYLAKWST